MKKTVIFLSMLFLCFMLVNSAVYASESVIKFGYVNIEKILQNYDYAKRVRKDLKEKESQITKFIKDQRNLFKKSDEKSRKALEKKSNEELSNRISALKTYTNEEFNIIENNIEKATKEVAKEEKYSLVLTDKSVVSGAEDITEKVIKHLNKVIK